MNKEWIEQQIRGSAVEHVLAPMETWVLGPIGMSKVAQDIAQAHEEELRNDQLAIMPCGHHASNATSGTDEDIDPRGESDGKTGYCKMCALEGQVAKLRGRLDEANEKSLNNYVRKRAAEYEVEQRTAQVAVMAEAWGKMAEIIDDAWCTSSDLEMTDPWAVIGAVRRVYKQAALQSAPTVLHSLKAKRTVNVSGDPLLAFPWEEDGVRVVQAYDPAMERYGDEWVDVIVLPKGEQAENSVQDLLDRASDHGYPPEEVEADIAQTVADVRQEESDE